MDMLGIWARALPLPRSVSGMEGGTRADKPGPGLFFDDKVPSSLLGEANPNEAAAAALPMGDLLTKAWDKKSCGCIPSTALVSVPRHKQRPPPPRSCAQQLFSPKP